MKEVKNIKKMKIMFAIIHFMPYIEFNDTNKGRDTMSEIIREDVSVFDYTSEILNALKKGVLLTTKAEGKVNTMVISWGALGIEWGRPIFTTYVREHRFTKSLLDKNAEFTVNIPLGEWDKKRIKRICGTQSGYDIDKIKETGLTLVDGVKVDVPAIKELALTLECKVIYKRKQDKNLMPSDIIEREYPQDVPGTYYGSNRDFHTAYYGEIVKAYILK